jgi:hypothetical protein
LGSPRRAHTNRDTNSDADAASGDRHAHVKRNADGDGRRHGDTNGERGPDRAGPGLFV